MSRGGGGGGVGGEGEDTVCIKISFSEPIGAVSQEGSSFPAESSRVK